MARQLRADIIEWSLRLNTTQAQEEYHKLDKANRALKAPPRLAPVSTRSMNTSRSEKGKRQELGFYSDLSYRAYLGDIAWMPHIRLHAQGLPPGGADPHRISRPHRPASRYGHRGRHKVCLRQRRQRARLPHTLARAHPRGA